MNKKFIKHTFLLILSIAVGIQAFAKDFPVSVTDGNGRTVTVKKQPKKVISLGAASTEILFEVGAEKQIAAVSDVSNYPEKATALPKIGGFDANTISVEKIISFKPDLVIIYSGMHEFLIPTLEKFKVPYYVSNDATIADVIDEIKDIAYLTGHKKTGDALEEKYNKIVSDIALASESVNKKSVYWEVWNAPYMSAGKQSFINDVISISGGKNIFADVDQAYPVVSEESIIASNPNVIMIPNDMYPTPTVESIKSRAGWGIIDAVQNDKIIIFNADIYTRSGPRVFDALQELNKILYEE